jgi:uncharacterized DUF497 family protein
VRFEWDPRKADANLRAHGIGFAEAVTVLEVAFALTREDPDAVEEQRFVANKRQESSEGHVEGALRRVLREELQGYRVRPKGGRTRR